MSGNMFASGSASGATPPANPFAGVFPAAKTDPAVKPLSQRMFESDADDDDYEEDDDGEETEPEGKNEDATDKLIEAYYEKVIQMVDDSKPTNGAECKKNHPFDSSNPLLGLPMGMVRPGPGDAKNQLPGPGILIRMGKKERQEDYEQFMKDFATKEVIEKAVNENLPQMVTIFRTYEKPAEKLVAMCESFGVRLEGKTRKYMVIGCATFLGTRYHMLNP